MQRKDHKSLNALADIFLFLLAGLQALIYQIFIIPNAFAPAGINGLATMVQYVFHFSIGYTSLLINIPLALLTFFFGDKRFAGKSLLFVLSFAFFTQHFQEGIIDVSALVYHTADGKSAILAPVASGAVNGFIYAMSLRCGGSTGGTDFIASFIHRRNPGYSMMRIIFTINVCVAGLSYFVYGLNIEPVILCIIYCLITSNMCEKLSKGLDQAIKVEIITSDSSAITNALIQNLHHGVTIIQGEGGYSRQERDLLICIINPHQLARMMDLLKDFPDTFAYVSDVNKTVGNFKRITR